MLDILYFLYFSKGEEDIPIGIPMTDTVFVVKDNEGQTVTKGKGLLYIGRLFFYPALVLFEQSNCIDSIHFCCILSLTKI